MCDIKSTDIKHMIVGYALDNISTNSTKPYRTINIKLAFERLIAQRFFVCYTERNLTYYHDILVFFNPLDEDNL